MSPSRDYPDEDKSSRSASSQRLEELLGTAPGDVAGGTDLGAPPRPIATAGMESPIDDASLEAMGYKDLDHYYRTEEKGGPGHLPHQRAAALLDPFKPPEESINFFRRSRDRRRPRLFVLADDGEKFGGCRNL